MPEGSYGWFRESYTNPKDTNYDKNNKHASFFFGKLLPMIVPKGIRPTFRPSINTAKPTMTATSPKKD